MNTTKSPAELDLNEMDELIVEAKRGVTPEREAAIVKRMKELNKRLKEGPSTMGYLGEGVVFPPETSEEQKK